MMKIFKTKSLRFKTIATVTMYCFVLQVISPLLISIQAYGQSGPSQAESSGFSLNSTGGMVNKFTGDFNFTIPLMDVEGYPITISYDQNIKMDTEASWVGLGWNLNVGSISRQKRGIPDDFNGDDLVRRTFKVKDEETLNGYKVGVVGNASFGSIGAGVSFLAGKYDHSYNGRGYTLDFGLKASSSTWGRFDFGPSLGLGVNVDTQNGIGRSFSIGVTKSAKGDNGTVGGFSATHTGNFNSRVGKYSKTMGLSGYLGAFGNGGGFKVSGQLGAPQSLGSITTIPKVDFPFHSDGSSNQIETGAFAMQGNATASADLVNTFYNSENSAKFTTITQNAYGYMHHGKREKNLNYYPIMDYNYGRSSAISEEMKVLPFAAPTYDMFSFSANGVQGQFRAQRHDVGTLKDATVVSEAEGSSNTFQAGVGVINPPQTNFAAKVGYVRGDQEGKQESGQWLVNGNEDFVFSGSPGHNKFDRAVFFKTVGEQTVTNTDNLEDLSGNRCLTRLPRDNGGGEVGLIDDVLAGLVPASNISSLGLSANGDNEVRATEYLMKTAEEREAEGADQIEFKDKNTAFNSASSTQDRTSDLRKKHHLSSTEVISSDGMRYVYDIPVYNNKQEDVMFSATGLKEQNTLFENEGLVSYVPTGSTADNSIKNDNGKTELFDKTVVPGYAHSFLLTEVLSPDYIDVDDNGPTANDIGNYYKFNYAQIYSENNPYSWRKPYSGSSSGGDPKAYFNDNFRATSQDDIANYTYGEKEMYLVHSVESKNMVAEFKISPREDAYAQDENGYIDTSKPGYKLDKIVLYNKSERRQNPNAVPLKVVEFEYDYTLCKDFPLNANSDPENNGKLTLKRIRIRGKNSEEKALAPYEFNYGTSGIQPGQNDPKNQDYSALNVDRWGNYKENNSNLPNYYYPYADEDVNALNASANNWKLQEIKTPTNGMLSIDYEADEYSYVQDKRVMSHYNILGMVDPMKLGILNDETFSNGTTPDVDNGLRASKTDFSNLVSEVQTLGGLTADKARGYIFGKLTDLDGKNLHHELPNNVVIFELEDSYLTNGNTSKADLEKQFEQDYLRDEDNVLLDELYCKTLVNIEPQESKWEVIPTFAKISKSIHARYNGIFGSLGLGPVQPYGLLGQGDEFKYGYVILENEGVNDVVMDEDGNKKFSKSPYEVNPIQKTAWQFSRRHLPEIVYADCNGNNCNYNLNIDAKVIFGGEVNEVMNEKTFCYYFDKDESSVRMFTQKRRKHVSNARVSSLTYFDNWSEMTSQNEEDSYYKWDYTYNEVDSDSSTYHGVAAYEPQIGNDVNPFFQWTRYTDIVESFPDQEKYTPEPFAEQLFPAPTIGYEEVSVAFDNPNDFNNTGESFSRFYTAKDFPTKTNRTEVNKSTSKKFPGLIISRQAIALTQGFVVETNNFHGKIKEKEVVDAIGNTQSVSKYNYFDLDNEVTTLDRSAQKRTETVALEYDIYSQASYTKKENRSFRIGGAAYVGWFLPNPIPTYGSVSPALGFIKHEQGIYTNTFNKIINRSAVLKSIETEYLGSHNTAKNIAFDRYSGKVLVSSLKDDYDDELFSMKYPAHWFFDNFRNYNRSSKEVNGVSLTNYEFSDPNQVFTEGDIVNVSPAGQIIGGIQAQVLRVLPSGLVWLMDMQGNLLNQNGTFDIKLIKTMRKNHLNRVMQSKTTKDDAFISGSAMNPNDHIISNKVVHFKEGGKMPCISGSENPEDPDYQEGNDVGDVVNPFELGLKGIYRIANSYTLQTGRTNFENNLGTRFDGIIENYLPFYDLNTNTSEVKKWKKIDESGHPDYPSNPPANFDYLQGYRKHGDIKKFDEYGKVTETVNQVDIKSSVLYGYNDQLKLVPTAQASNAQQNQLAFDGFEDYNYAPENSSLQSSLEPHFSFNNSSIQLTETERHSGKRSLVIGPTDNVSETRDITNVVDQDECGRRLIKHHEGYVVQECDCTSGFSPSEGKYIVSAWVKVKNKPTAIDYSAPRIDVLQDLTITDNLSPSGKIIDGWQKIEGVIEVNSGTSEITMALVNSGSQEVYFDDFRVHPYHAQMNTIVYDPETLLPLAKHDNYNYTTFYNYDENYDLVSIKVETVEGIKTISAEESGFVKKFNNN